MLKSPPMIQCLSPMIALRDLREFRKRSLVGAEGGPYTLETKPEEVVPMMLKWDDNVRAVEKKEVKVTSAGFHKMTRPHVAPWALVSIT
jgi:hypothetical protein